jgi:hypothetical protein
MSYANRDILPSRGAGGVDMNDEWAGVAERMADEFVHLPWNAVLQAVCACAEECEFADSLFLEQAVRARLTAGVLSSETAG